MRWSSSAEYPESLVVYVNGEHLPASHAKVSVFDSGLNFADGVFEGVRVYNGRVYRLGEHVRRLFESARAFSIEVGLSPEELINDILDWLRANDVRDDFHFRPIVTRGDRFPPRLDPRFARSRARVILIGGPIVSEPTRCLTAVVSSYRRVSADALDPKIKSLNYGNNLLGRLEAQRRGVDEVVMLDGSGFLAEASAANLFLLRRGSLVTPYPKACLEGITRATVMELAAEADIECHERDLTVTDLLNADEAFICGTGVEIAPLVLVEGTTIGSGTAGKVTELLIARYAERVRSQGTPLWT